MLFLKAYYKMCEKFSELVSSGCVRPLPYESTTYSPESLCSILNFIDAWFNNYSVIMSDIALIIKKILYNISKRLPQQILNQLLKTLKRNDNYF